MFDMIRNSGENDGYELRITYNKKYGDYGIRGFVIRLVNNRIQCEADGATISFPTLESALKYIEDYPESLRKLAGL
jgi:hypothetical protein